MDYNNPSVAYQVFHNTYPCEMQTMHMYTPEYISQMGMPTYGSPELDRENLASYQGFHLTPAAMAMHISEGATIRVQNPKDLLKIYDLVTQHIRNWHWICQNYFGIKAPPLEDFMAFDELARLLHPYAMALSGQRPRSGLQSFIMELRGDHMRVMDSQLAVLEKKAGITREKKVESIPYESYAGELAKLLRWKDGSPGQSDFQ